MRDGTFVRQSCICCSVSREHFGSMKGAGGKDMEDTVGALENI